MDGGAVARATRRTLLKALPNDRVYTASEVIQARERISPSAHRYAGTKNISEDGIAPRGPLV